MSGDGNNPDSNKEPPKPLANRLALIGAAVVGLLVTLVVAPQLFPNAEGQGFNIYRVLSAAAGGGIGAAIGWGVGRMIEGSGKPK
jgi:hypothetical protein